MMYCPNCGFDVGESQFCSKCGAKISGGKEAEMGATSERDVKKQGNGIQEKVQKALGWFKAQEPKKRIAMVAGVAVALVLLFTLAFGTGGAGGNVKKQLCDGVWCYQMHMSDFTGVFGSSFRTYVYEFKPNNTYTVYSGLCYNSSAGALLDEPMEEYDTGKYTIDTENCQIIMQSNEGSTEEKPYAINEYTHELIFSVRSSGESNFWHEDSLEDGLYWYDLERS